MLLSELTAQANLRSTPKGETEIATLSDDSRRVNPGALFICRPSKTRDTHDLLPEAKAQGAVAALVHSLEGQSKADTLGLPSVLVDTHPEAPGATEELRVRAESGEFSDAVWRLCQALYGDPGARIPLYGVTGTNGKTTVAWMIHQLLPQGAYLGTLGFRAPGIVRELANTTPFAPEAYRLLHEAADAYASAAALEISSHALAERRVDGISLEVAAFTNLSRDHLDYHGDFEAYVAAKTRLYDEFEVKNRVFNVDDPVGATLADRFPDAWRVSFRPGPAHRRFIRVVPIKVGLDRLSVCLNGAPFEAPLGGAYHVENLGVALASLFAAGHEIEDLAARAKVMKPVPGRFEPVPNDRGLSILIDYAHTPDGLEKLLKAARAGAQGRVIVVFGCGGDRDRGKRPLMGAIAAELADRVILTNDNPRAEDPAEIVRDIRSSMTPDPTVLLDRSEAVAEAIRGAEPGDVVVIAGKGHENYQIIGREKQPMDDRDLVREALA